MYRADAWPVVFLVETLMLGNGLMQRTCSIRWLPASWLKAAGADPLVDVAWWHRAGFSARLPCQDHIFSRNIISAVWGPWVTDSLNPAGARTLTGYGWKHRWLAYQCCQSSVTCNGLFPLSTGPSLIIKPSLIMFRLILDDLSRIGTCMHRWLNLGTYCIVGGA